LNGDADHPNQTLNGQYVPVTEALDRRTRDEASDDCIRFSAVAGLIGLTHICQYTRWIGSD